MDQVINVIHRNICQDVRAYMVKSICIATALNLGGGGRLQQQAWW